MHVISVLRMKDTTLAEWRRLPKIGLHTGDTGQTTSGLWAWTLTYRGSGTPRGCVSSQVSLPASNVGHMDGGSKSRLARSLALSRPLGRRSRWPVGKTPQRFSGVTKSSHDCNKYMMGGGRRTRPQQNNSQWKPTFPNV
jgi:hypothetical protein